MVHLFQSFGDIEFQVIEKEMAGYMRYLSVLESSSPKSEIIYATYAASF
jgi:hypothetical protein